MLKTIDSDVKTLMAGNPDIFSANRARDVMVEIRDFQTAGVVSFARGYPFYAQKPGGRRIRDVRRWPPAGTWVAGPLTANEPRPAWPEDFPMMCQTIVARAQVQHEIDEDLDQLADRDDRDPCDRAGSR